MLAKLRNINKFYMNRMGRLVYMDDDGTATPQGLKPTLVGLVFTNAIAGYCIWYGYQLGKEQGAMEGYVSGAESEEILRDLEDNTLIKSLNAEVQELMAENKTLKQRIARLTNTST
jgi:hypothetical protein